MKHALRQRSRRQTVALCLLSAFGGIFLAGCHRLPPPTPLDQLNAQQTHGHDLFQVRCAQCHYDRVDEPRNGPALRSIFKKPYLHSGAPANDERVSATILHGRNLMPAQPMEPQDLDDLLAYLHTL